MRPAGGTVVSVTYHDLVIVPGLSRLGTGGDPHIVSIPTAAISQCQAIFGGE
jgi:hypothetical protein